MNNSKIKKIVAFINIILNFPILYVLFFGTEQMTFNAIDISILLINTTITCIAVTKSIKVLTNNETKLKPDIIFTLLNYGILIFIFLLDLIINPIVLGNWTH